MLTEPLFDLQTVAKLLGVHYRTVKRWADMGRLELVTLPGGQLRVTGSELSRITQGKVQVKPETEEA